MASEIVPGTVSSVDPFLDRSTVLAPCGSPIIVSVIGASNPSAVVTLIVNSPWEPLGTDNDVGWTFKSKSVTVTVTFAVRFMTCESGREYEAAIYKGNVPKGASEAAATLILTIVPGRPLLGVNTVTPFGAPDADIVTSSLKLLIDVRFRKVKAGVVAFLYIVTV